MAAHAYTLDLALATNGLLSSGKRQYPLVCQYVCMSDEFLIIMLL